MAVITSWSTLKTEIANQLNRTDLTADVPFFVQLAGIVLLVVGSAGAS